MRQDNRTKDPSQWTYYVVDHVPSMSNIYFYDTLQEAISHYQDLPSNQVKAIGSSINGSHEIDHIHCRGGKNVLVMDSHNKFPWNSSGEIQSAIDTMIAYLNVQYQLSSMFSRTCPSVMIELERYQFSDLENYFHDKLLRPEDPKLLLSAVSEVYVEGAGWLKRDAFFQRLENSRPKKPGEGAKANFVTRVNIDYIDESGRLGQADLSTKNFRLLLEKTQRETSAEKLAEDLFHFAETVDPYEAMDQADTNDAQLASIKHDIASGRLGPYIKFITDYLYEGAENEDVEKQAKKLLSRLMVLTPKDFRKRALVAMIQGAQEKAKEQAQNSSVPRSPDKMR